MLDKFFKRLEARKAASVADAGRPTGPQVSAPEIEMLRSGEDATAALNKEPAAGSVLEERSVSPPTSSRAEHAEATSTARSEDSAADKRRQVSIWACAVQEMTREAKNDYEDAIQQLGATKKKMLSAALSPPAIQRELLKCVSTLEVLQFHLSAVLRSPQIGSPSQSGALEAAEAAARDLTKFGQRVDAFFAACVVADEDQRIAAAELWWCYTEWCDYMQVKPLSQKIFRTHLTKLGVKRKKSRGLIYYQGVKLNESALSEVMRELMFKIPTREQLEKMKKS